MASVLLVTGACTGGSRDTDEARGATRAFLDALVDGRAEAAFDETTFAAGNGSDGPKDTPPVDREHFVAAFEQQPVSGYEVISRHGQLTRVELTTPLAT